MKKTDYIDRILGLPDWSDMPTNNDLRIAVTYLPPMNADPDLFADTLLIEDHSYNFQYD